MTRNDQPEEPSASWERIGDHARGPLIAVRFGGLYPLGAEGVEFGRAMVGFLRSVLAETNAAGVIFDLTALEYVWGDGIGELGMALFEKGRGFRPAAIVAMGGTAHALEPLCEPNLLLGIAGVKIVRTRDEARAQVEQALALRERACDLDAATGRSEAVTETASRIRAEGVGEPSGSRPPGIGESWKLISMPNRRTRLHFRRAFSAKEYSQIRRGLIPKEMEDKWCIVLADDWLYFHRSWTGLCIYQLRLAPAGQGYRVAEAWVNQDPQQYHGTDDFYDRTFLNGLIDYFLLKADAHMPVPADLVADWSPSKLEPDQAWVCVLRCFVSCSIAGAFVAACVWLGRSARELEDWLIATTALVSQTPYWLMLGDLRRDDWRRAFRRVQLSSRVLLTVGMLGLLAGLVRAPWTAMLWAAAVVIQVLIWFAGKKAGRFTYIWSQQDG